MPAHLLIAGSDTSLCDSYQAYLRAVGFEVETAADGIDCLERLRTSRPDALVIDVDLPWGGGDGVLACLAGRSGAEPRAVVAIGSMPPAELADRLGLAETYCLEKPAHASSLMLRLATLLFDPASTPPVARPS